MNCNMNKIKYIIVGVGMNINIKKEDFSSDLNATSLLIEKNTKYNRAEILANFLNHFEIFYNNFIDKNDLSEVINICRNNSLFINKIDNLVTSKNIETVTCIGLDNSGELIIKDSFGRIRKVISGELTFKNQNTQ